MSAEAYKGETLTKPCIVLMEGVDDARFIDAMVQHMQIADVLQIIEAQGKTRLPTRLRTLHAVEGFSNVCTIGIIRDADDNPQGAFESVRNAMRDAALPYPTQAGEITTCSPNSPATSVFIVPSPDSTGSLEDLCQQSLQSDKRMTCVRRFLRCVQERKYVLQQLTKSQMAAFLAIQEQTPSISLGIAAMRGVFNLSHPAFEPLRQFLQALASQVQSA